ncbi:MAG: endonuclease/exonuclease/phosphatase family protein [Cyanobacteria bacterium J06621_11]
MKLVLKVLGLMVGLPAIALTIFFFWGSAGTTDQETYDDIVRYDALGPAVKNGYTIVSYNIGYLSGLANNTKNKPERSFFEANLQRAIASLAEVTPDIIGFQEIDFSAKRSYNENQMDQVAQALEMNSGAIAVNWDKNYLPFPYWPPAAHFGKILSGQAILSRYAIEKNSRIVLERLADKSFIYNAFYLDRLAQVSQISLDGQPVVVINVHLEAFSESTRMSQTQFVRSLAEDYAQTLPVIVIGDFNSALNRPSFVTGDGETHEERQFSIKEMLASDLLAPAIAESDWSVANATFPSNDPQYKLDYIFYTPSTIEVINTKVLTTAEDSSDHLPLMMQFRFKQEAL